jgi:hypothetical protein
VDGNLIELNQTVTLAHTLFYKNGIQVFHVGQTYQLVDRSVVSDIPL